jgi:hypothetical protein
MKTKQNHIEIHILISIQTATTYKLLALRAPSLYLLRLLVARLPVLGVLLVALVRVLPLDSHKGLAGVLPTLLDRHLLVHTVLLEYLHLDPSLHPRAL